MKLVTVDTESGNKSKGLFVEDNFFTEKELIKVRKWARNNIRSGIGCQNKTGLGDADKDYSGQKIHNLASVATGKKHVWGHKTIVRNTLNKVYTKLKTIKVECINNPLFSYDIALNPQNLGKIKADHMYMDVHSSKWKGSFTEQQQPVGYSLNWHQDPSRSLTFLIYLHKEWEDDWGGEFMWSTERTDMLKSDGHEYKIGGKIKCKPNRIIIDTMNINHKVNDVKIKMTGLTKGFIAERLALHGWAW